MRPANPTRAISLTKSCQSGVDNARVHLRTGNPGAYARSLAGLHRSSSERQQRAIEAVIASDATTHLFTRHVGNGCLLARQG
ncbi:hypothetical protein [Sphingomonas jatrophae]|uniref:Uncharacterized protein n=1 Tax=Sphingomonas jatrophae TaxID=1166337 RepID=A0A1I6M9M4_9SPHN|nr:hypothetical protein [Sphingomonas jatrophae]SFS12399.1 hypothetical protein SAMN05192580_3736 [Sphingomonas jatrophae]